ncbi:hypothetical protein AVEN_99609-1 [Araneus ventricosus]|uniref:Uncharacterized protein n=1 Tax=Araneus ventricosus TaxID=182803 RepID=A0A4Y2EQ49_ARAVE|nr:hypothetical protein AVEN_99609-1 [Araneus ventricosus]
MHWKPVEETVTEEFISVIDSSINEFSARFSQFKELSETLKFIMYPDVTPFDKLNFSQFDWLEIEEFEMQLIDFQSSSTWTQKFIETRAISFCIYGSEDFHSEIREKVIQNITTKKEKEKKDFTILKESVVSKEYKIYYGFMVCSTDLHAEAKKVASESLEAARWQGQC